MLNLAYLGGGQSDYWVGTLSSADSVYFDGVALNGTGGVYLSGNIIASGVDYGFIAKIGPLGLVDWQRKLGGTAYFQGVGSDSSGNAYVAGRASIGGVLKIEIAKYNSSGTIQWQRSLGGAANAVSNAVATDSSGNCYVAGSGGSGTAVAYFAKYNSSGTLQWQRQFTVGGGGANYRSVTAASGDIHAVGVSNRCLTVKYNTSGTAQWARRLNDLNVTDGYCVTADSSGNVYVGGYYDNGTNPGMAIVAKYNSSGTLQWQRRLSGAGFTSTAGIALDASGNIYLALYAENSGGTASSGGIVKYSNSGTIQWQRSVSLAGADYTGFYQPVVDSSGALWVVGYADAAGLIVKLPSDGSLTGTYTLGSQTLTYAASSLTDAAATFTEETPTYTDSALSLTDASTSLTDATTSFTSTVTAL